MAEINAGTILDAPLSPTAAMTTKSGEDTKMNNIQQQVDHQQHYNNYHRRFQNVDEYVNVLGGVKKWYISKILIANNGVAAVKAIRSIRRWAYEVFGNERTIQFVVMATPEDLRYVNVICISNENDLFV